MPTTPIFVDTSFVIALINERDQYHAQALELADKVDGQSLLITDAVLLEVGNALARSYKVEAIEVIDDLLSSEDVEVVRLTTELFSQAFELYKTQIDKTWGLVDCISFVVMQNQNIGRVLTFDHHFVQAGFQVLPLA
ncbi:MAG: PIN domain-containing protein [Chloroflexi bacterium]|nr:PIN domain-containing protein [Chloroflexota bacterium]